MIYHFLFQKCLFHLYADDTVFYFSDKDPLVVEKILNDELKKVDKWMNTNRLKLNCKKTDSMLFGTRHMGHSLESEPFGHTRDHLICLIARKSDNMFNFFLL